MSLSRFRLRKNLALAKNGLNVAFYYRQSIRYLWFWNWMSRDCDFQQIEIATRCTENEWKMLKNCEKGKCDRFRCYITEFQRKICRELSQNSRNLLRFFTTKYSSMKTPWCTVWICNFPKLNEFFTIFPFYQ